MRAARFALVLALLVLPMASAEAQQHGGILHIGHRDSSASMSPLEEVTILTTAPMMAVFNNLVLLTSTSRKTRCSRSCLIWPRAGRGAPTAPN
jgi:hypothetical protein